VIDEQASVELAARRPRDAKGVEALTGRGAGDRDGVDRVGLAALASRPTTRPTARPAPHEVRCEKFRPRPVFHSPHLG
jgi:hypothetical protein